MTARATYLIEVATVQPGIGLPGLDKLVELAASSLADALAGDGSYPVHVRLSTPLELLAEHILGPEPEQP